MWLAVSASVTTIGVYQVARYGQQCVPLMLFFVYPAFYRSQILI